MLKRIQSYQLLRRISKANSSSPTLTLPDYQMEILRDCVVQMRSEIFKIEDNVIALLSNLLTIARCFEPILPSHCQLTLLFLREDDNGNSTILDLCSELHQLARVCADEVKQLQSTRFHSIIKSGKLQPTGWRVEQMRISETERVISPPTSISATYAHQNQKARAQVELEMLVLKKAEMLFRVEELGKEMEFWTKSYNDVRSLQSRLNIGPSIRRKEVSVDGMIRKICMSVSVEEKEDGKRKDSGVCV